MKTRWEQAVIKAFISPIYPSVAFKAENAEDLSVMFDYTVMWNAIHYPAGTVPVTVVQEGEETYQDEYNDLWTSAIKKDIKGSVGMPVGVQVVSYIFEDETCLGIMKALDDYIKFDQVPQI